MAPLPWEEMDPFSISMYAQESAYWSSLQESEALMRLCSELSNETGRREMVEGCIERLCKLCWSEAIEAVDCHTLLIAARAEVDHLKRRLSQLNLMTVKQMVAQDTLEERSRSSLSLSPSFEDLQQDQKDLVYGLVWEKIRELRDPIDASSTILALQDYAAQCGLFAGCAETVDTGINTEVEGSDVFQRCEELQLSVSNGEAKLLQLRCDFLRLEDKLAESTVDLQVTKEQLQDTLQQLEESKTGEEVLRKAFETLQEEHNLQLKAHEDSRQEVLHLQSELLRREGQVRGLGRRPSASRKLPDSRPPSSPLPLLQGPVSYSDAALEEPSPGFTVNRKAKAMQVSTSLPSLQRGEAAGPPAQSSLLPRSKRPFVI